MPGTYNVYTCEDCEKETFVIIIRRQPHVIMFIARVHLHHQDSRANDCEPALPVQGTHLNE